MDFTPVISAIDVIPVVLAIAAIAAIKILPSVARWAFSQVFGFFEDFDNSKNFTANKVNTDVKKDKADSKVKSGVGGSSSSVHPAFAPFVLPESVPVVQSTAVPSVLPEPVPVVQSTAESNLSPESRFKVFGAIFGFFGGFFSKFFSFFKRK